MSDITPPRQGGIKRLKELGYSVNKPEADDGREAVLGGWRPTELVDLPEMEEAAASANEVFGKPGTKSALAAAVDNKYDEKNLPRQFDLPKPTVKTANRLQDGSLPGEARKADPSKVITNITEDIEPSKLTTESRGYSVPQDFEDPPPELHGYERLDLVSGPVPYMHMEEFKNGVFVRPLNPIDAARISRAVRSRSLTALLDALNHTINVPYRYLTIADHEQIMYWHMLNSYPVEPFNVGWHSIYTRERINTTVRQPKIKETKLRITERQFLDLRAKGLDMPRVMSLDIGDTIVQMPVDPPGTHKDPIKEKEAKDLRDQKDDMIYLLFYMQFIDVNNKDVRAKIREQKDTVQPRLRGLMAYLSERKNLDIFQHVREFSESIQYYGITETFEAACAREMLVAPALNALRDYLISYPDTDKPVATEIERLEKILESTPEDQRDSVTFEPIKEETTVPRSPWSFFSFL